MRLSYIDLIDDDAVSDDNQLRDLADQAGLDWAQLIENVGTITSGFFHEGHGSHDMGDADDVVEAASRLMADQADVEWSESFARDVAEVLRTRNGFAAAEWDTASGKALAKVTDKWLAGDDEGDDMIDRTEETSTQLEAYTTIGDLEDYWSCYHDEWGLRGPDNAQRHEQVRLVRKHDQTEWTLEREADGMWFQALPDPLDDEDVPGITKVLRTRNSEADDGEGDDTEEELAISEPHSCQYRVPDVGEVVAARRAGYLLQPPEKQTEHQVTVVDVERVPSGEDEMIYVTYEDEHGGRHRFGNSRTRMERARRKNAAKQLEQAAEAYEPADHLKAAREILGLSRKAMSQRMGIPTSGRQAPTLRDWESGRRKPQDEGRQKIRAFADDLLD